MVTQKERNQNEVQEKLQRAMEQAGVDGLILTECCSIYYATGHYSTFQMNASVPGYCIAVLPAKGKFTVIMPDYEALSREWQCPGVDMEIVMTGIYIDKIEQITGMAAPKERSSTVDGSKTFRMALEILKKQKSNPVIGIQTRLLTADAMEIFRQNAGGCTYIDCESLLDRVRMIKTDWEIEVLRTAARMSEHAMSQTAEQLCEGMPVAEVVNRYYRNCLAQDMNVVGAHPVASIGGRYYGCFYIPPADVLQRGDLVRLDCGPYYLGYISDICRNYSVGPACDEAKRIYEALMKGYRRELELIGPGVKIADVFHEVQQTVRDAGIPDYLRGHLGHSIGTYTLGEEYPYISPNVEEVFQPGMVLSAEIPYNNPLIGGLTPEDSLVITQDGYERFTYVPEEIVELNG